jgi:hypothetical protein
VALRVPGRLRPRIISTFGTTRVVGCQPYAPAAFTPWEIPGTHFQKLSRPQGTWFCRKETQKKSPMTPPRINPGTVRVVVQRLNHYATPGPDGATVGQTNDNYMEVWCVPSATHVYIHTEVWRVCSDCSLCPIFWKSFITSCQKWDSCTWATLPWLQYAFQYTCVNDYQDCLRHTCVQC